MKFNYTFDIGCGNYYEDSDEVFYDSVDYEYEPDEDELQEVVIDIICDKYGFTKKQFREFYQDFDLQNCELEEGLEDELKDYFEDDAKEQYWQDRE